KERSLMKVHLTLKNDLKMENTCKNPDCDNLIPEGKKLYCSESCKRTAQNKRAWVKKTNLGGLTASEEIQHNEIHMENSNQESFGLQLLNPGAGMPVPKDPASVQYALFEYKSKLDMAIAEVRRLMDKDETNKEKIREKEREVDDLKRTIEKMEGEKNAKSGIGQVLDGFRDEGGQLDMAGLGQLVKGAGEGLAAVMNKGASAPSQLTGLDAEKPAEIKEHVTAFTNWFSGIDPQQRETAWSVINAMASSPELAIQFINIIQHANIRQTAN
ncbi:MAG: hypothetical protein KAI29_03730, partial [Cyclobacteriaceae bacterium]|nr:hypothetical protein [Cyclobacteriaceae bacterium]